MTENGGRGRTRGPAAAARFIPGPDRHVLSHFAISATEGFMLDSGGLPAPIGPPPISEPTCRDERAAEAAAAGLGRASPPEDGAAAADGSCPNVVRRVLTRIATPR